MMKQTVRIIGGQYRGKKLYFPDVADLRPTPDRVRETLFNWLMHDIRDACCLDAFAGSGALGLEAFSRGAAEVVLLEKSPEIYANLQKTIKTFDSDKLHVIQLDAQDYLLQINKPFDLIFLDPPYANPEILAQCLNRLSQSEILPPSGLVFIESNLEITPDPESWVTLKRKKAGQVMYALLQKKGSIWVRP